MGVNWVRFAYLGRGAGGDWVRFEYLGLEEGRLGSFRIMCPDRSEEILNPNIEIRNKPEIRNAKLET